MQERIKKPESDLIVTGSTAIFWILNISHSLSVTLNCYTTQPMCHAVYIIWECCSHKHQSEVYHSLKGFYFWIKLHKEKRCRLFAANYRKRLCGLQHTLSQRALILLHLIKNVLWGVINPGNHKSRDNWGVIVAGSVCSCAVCRGGQVVEIHLARGRTGKWP